MYRITSPKEHSCGQTWYEWIIYFVHELDNREDIRDFPCTRSKLSTHTEIIIRKLNPKQCYNSIHRLFGIKITFGEQRCPVIMYVSMVATIRIPPRGSMSKQTNSPPVFIPFVLHYSNKLTSSITSVLCRWLKFRAYAYM